jgi:hypothetical protein
VGVVKAAWTAFWAAALLASASVSSAANPQETLRDAERRVTKAARDQRLSEAETQQAVSVLRELAGAGFPLTHAVRVVTVAIADERSGQEIAAIARDMQSAHRRGASSRELANLAEDLSGSDMDTKGILTAIEAVGRLAEDGFTDGETRRAVSLAALHGLKDGRRGEALSETIRDEARDKSSRGSGENPAAAGSGGATGRERAAEARDRADLRDELRRNPPAGVPADRGPAGVPQRGKGKGKKTGKGGGKT